MTARSLAARPARIVMRRYVSARTRAWPDTSRLFAVGERTSWSVDEDARHLEATARRLGFEVAPSGWARLAGGQAVFLTIYCVGRFDHHLTNGPEPASGPAGAGSGRPGGT